MEFKSEAQKLCYEKVASWLKEIFGELVVAHQNIPLHYVLLGSAVANVAVLPWRENDAVINARSYVVTEVEVTPDLANYLLRENSELVFGAFGVDQDGDILFQHTILGSTCDKEELKASVLAVATTADRYDDEIVARWGGRRAIDRRT